MALALTPALTPAILFSAGYGFAAATSLEAEVKKGKNYPLASMYQVIQVYNLSTVTYVCIDQLPSSSLKTAASICNHAAPWLSLVICPYAASVKRDDKSSETRSQFTIRTFHFIANHASHLATVGMVAATAAQYVLAGPYYAGAVAAPVLYQVVENLNMVPRSISRFVETTMPFIASATFALGGPLLNRAISILNLVGFIPAVGCRVQHVFDRTNQYLIPSSIKDNIPSWTLAEAESTLILPKNLTFSNMRTILAADSYQFELNPKHFTKSTGIRLRAKKKYPIPILMEMFKNMSIFKEWNANVEKWLIRRLSEDERFIDFLKDQFPDKSEHAKNCRILIVELAKKSNPSEKDVPNAIKIYLKALLEKQMQECVDVLTNKRKAKGSAIDILEAQTQCSVVLEHLVDLKSSVEREDILIKLAIEGGGYCARAIKRVFLELREPIISYRLKAIADPSQLYELQILYELEKDRHRLADAAHLQFMDEIVAISTIMKDRNGYHYEERSRLNETSLSTVKSSTAYNMSGDIHIRDIYRTVFALGFVPLSCRERRAITLNQVYMWGSCIYPFRKYRKFMKDAYDPNAAMNELGRARFTDYWLQKIRSSNQLSNGEKTKLQEILAGGDEGRCQWPLSEIQERFQQLFLYMFGVLRLKSNSSVSLAENPKDWEFYQLDAEFEKDPKLFASEFDEKDLKSEGEVGWTLLQKAPT